jgi:hypothetical protein
MDTTNCVTNLITHYHDWEGAKVLQLITNQPDTDIYATVVELCLANSVPPSEAQANLYHLAPIKMTDDTTLNQVKKRLNQLIAQKANGMANSDLPQLIMESLQPSPEPKLSPNYEAARTTHAPYPPQPSPFVVHSTVQQETNLNQTLVESTPNSNADETSAATLTPDIDADIQALTAYIKETTLTTGCIKCFNDEDTKAYRRQSAAISRLLHKAEKDGHHEAVAIIKANLKKGKIIRWEEGG